jgi:hypothetical protein
MNDTKVASASDSALWLRAVARLQPTTSSSAPVDIRYSAQKAM